MTKGFQTALLFEAVMQHKIHKNHLSPWTVITKILETKLTLQIRVTFFWGCALKCRWNVVVHVVQEFESWKRGRGNQRLIKPLVSSRLGTTSRHIIQHSFNRYIHFVEKLPHLNCYVRLEKLFLSKQIEFTGKYGGCFVLRPTSTAIANNSINNHKKSLIIFHLQLCRTLSAVINSFLMKLPCRHSACELSRWQKLTRAGLPQPITPAKWAHSAGNVQDTSPERGAV